MSDEIIARMKAKLEHRIRLLREARDLIDEALLIQQPDCHEADVELLSAMAKVVTLSEYNFRIQGQSLEQSLSDAAVKWNEDIAKR